jgi:hypothetical protein
VCTTSAGTLSRSFRRASSSTDDSNFAIDRGSLGSASCGTPGSDEVGYSRRRQGLPREGARSVSRPTRLPLSGSLASRFRAPAIVRFALVFQGRRQEVGRPRRFLLGARRGEALSGRVNSSEPAREAGAGPIYRGSRGLAHGWR